MAGFLMLLVAFFLTANRIGLAAHLVGLQFGELFLLDLALDLVFIARDTLAIDA